MLIETRSGTNEFHGDGYDYFRNTVLDANNWFNNAAGLPRSPEQQNDFGGVFGGPLIRDKTFFFFSYEGLRLSTPTPAQTTFVPDAAMRQAGPEALKPYLNAYPIPNGLDNTATGVAQFVAAFSTPSTLDVEAML